MKAHIDSMGRGEAGLLAMCHMMLSPISHDVRPEHPKEAGLKLKSPLLHCLPQMRECQPVDLKLENHRCGDYNYTDLTGHQKRAN